MRKNKVKKRQLNTKSDSKDDTKNRGRKSDYTDTELKEIALRVKIENNGIELSYSLLEKETGIGRNTWARKIADTIKDLNRPIVRKQKDEGLGDVYFPSIEQIFDIYGSDQSALMNELLLWQLQYQDMYDELRNLEKQVEKYKESIGEVESLINEKNYQEQRANTYEHLRKENGIVDNVIDFERNIERNASVDGGILSACCCNTGNRRGSFYKQKTNKS